MIFVLLMTWLSTNDLYLEFVADSGFIDNNSVKTFYVVGHDWHTGIVIKADDISDSLKPKHPLFPQGRYLEIGWGDKDFYQNSGPDIDFYLAIKAALWPTESVLHINSFDELPEKYYYLSNLIKFKISKDDFENLYKFIFNTFARDSVGDELWAGKGHYRNSQFFLGAEKYYFPKTCNVWTAQAINKAGFSISPYRFQTAESLIEYIRNFGESILKSEK